jgi:hypothetical protein
VRWISIVLLAALAAALPPPAALARQAPAEEELPEGDGRTILLDACTSCHGLDEVTKFRGYYDRKQWRDVVVTMVEYGAPVDPLQVDVLADYLVQHLGRQPSATPAPQP